MIYPVARKDCYTGISKKKRRYNPMSNLSIKKGYITFDRYTDRLLNYIIAHDNDKPFTMR